VVADLFDCLFQHQRHVAAADRAKKHPSSVTNVNCERAAVLGVLYVLSQMMESVYNPHDSSGKYSLL
jgi:hypothetical protein